MFRGSNTKEESHLLPLNSRGEAPPFAINVKGGEKPGARARMILRMETYFKM
jgi:hypothetical protein